MATSESRRENAAAGRHVGRSVSRRGKIMNRLRHPHLVRLLGVCTVDEPIYVITELMVHGSLRDYLRHDQGRGISTPVSINMAAQVGLYM